MLELRACTQGSMLCCLCSASAASQHKQVIFTALQLLLTQAGLDTAQFTVLSQCPHVTAADTDNKWSNVYLFIWFSLGFFASALS